MPVSFLGSSLIVLVLSLDRSRFYTVRSSLPDLPGLPGLPDLP